MRQLKKLVFLLWTFPLLADEQGVHQFGLTTKERPWFTGNLIAPSGYTVAQGHWNFEPYFFYTVKTGQYNSHWRPSSVPHFKNQILQFQIKVGLLSRMDFQFYPAVQRNSTEGEHFVGISDMPVGVNFQVLKFNPEDPWPSMKLLLKVNAPFGKYQHLNPGRKKTDAIGIGSLSPSVGFVLTKLFHTSGIHFIDTRFYVNYIVGTRVHVRRSNTYGGDKTTRGKVYPGNTLTIDLASQIELTQNWAFAFDLIYEHVNKNRFTGKTAASMISPSTEQFSFAPAIEYNWSQNLGIIVGPWFTLAGRNAARFWSGVAAIDAYF